MTRGGGVGLILSREARYSYPGVRHPVRIEVKLCAHRFSWGKSYAEPNTTLTWRRPSSEPLDHMGVTIVDRLRTAPRRLPPDAGASSCPGDAGADFAHAGVKIELSREVRRQTLVHRLSSRATVTRESSHMMSKVTGRGRGSAMGKHQLAMPVLVAFLVAGAAACNAPSPSASPSARGQSVGRDSHRRPRDRRGGAGRRAHQKRWCGSRPGGATPDKSLRHGRRLRDARRHRLAE